MTTLRVIIYFLVFGTIGAVLFLLSIVLLPLAMLGLIGMIFYLGFRIITYEDKNSSK